MVIKFKQIHLIIIIKKCKINNGRNLMNLLNSLKNKNDFFIFIYYLLLINKFFKIKEDKKMFHICVYKYKLNSKFYILFN
jgi:hypothetical protein